MSVSEEDVRPGRRVQHPVGDVSLTRQADAKDADIKNIVTRWKETGVVMGARGTPSFGDFSGQVDYHEALTRVKTAEADFYDLPAKVRTLAENDPGKFLEMVRDPDQVDELVEAGLPESFADQVADLVTQAVAAAGDVALEASHQEGPQKPEDGPEAAKPAGKEADSQ